MSTDPRVFRASQVLSDAIPCVNVEAWMHANKVCCHTILTTLSNELFDVYYA